MIKVKKMFSIVAACRSICGKVYFSDTPVLPAGGYAARGRVRRDSACCGLFGGIAADSGVIRFTEKHSFSANRAASRGEARTEPKAGWLLLAITVIVGAIALNISAAPVDDLRKGFEHPTDDARIMMRWWWFGPSVTKAEIERELRVMKEGGIGGVEVQPVYPLLPDDEAHGIKNLPYLSDEFLDMLRFAAQKSKELGMRFDLTLGSGWSFGGAKTPINEAAGQLRFEHVKVDASTRRVPLPSMIPTEKLMAVFLAKPSANLSSAGDIKELTDIHDDSV